MLPKYTHATYINNLVAIIEIFEELNILWCNYDVIFVARRICHRIQVERGETRLEPAK